jgi:membrane-associated protease RseP (regulator of RpoE activity)
MALIVYFLFEGLYKLIYMPEAPATLAPVIPGVPIPGSPIFVPFWYGITALFVVVAVHEFSHGVVSAAHKIKVKNSGIVFFGPLIGAFVEPDEDQLKKKNWWVQESMFAAGPFSNGLLALLAIIIVIFGLYPILSGMVTPTGFYFEDVSEGFPALAAGVQPNVIYSMVNGVEVNNASYLENLLANMTPGDTFTIGNENLTHTITSVENPDKPGRAFMGILGLQTDYVVKNPASQWKYDFLIVLLKFFQWVFILSIGIGLANLLPLGPVDGGRMLLLSMKAKLGDEKSMKIFSKITAFLILIIIVLLFVPIIKALI